MHRVSSLSSLACAGLLTLGCDAAPDRDSGPAVTAQAATAAVTSALGTAEVRVRADGLTLWLDEQAQITPRSGGMQVTLRGRTSANLSAVASYVPDDAFGRAVLTGPRSFEITLRDGHEINTIASGLPLFLSLSLHSGKTYGGKLGLAARVLPTPGPVTIEPLLRPVYIRDTTNNLRYRGTAQSPSPLAIRTLGGVDPVLTSAGMGRFLYDWDYSGLSQLLDSSSDRVFFSTATTSQSSALALVVHEVGLVRGDAASAWPSPACSRTAYDCIRALPASTRDYASCGSYREVARCIGAEICDVVPRPPVTLALAVRDASSLDAAVRAAHAACPRTGGSWCSVGPALAFTHPRCLSTPPTVQQINEEALRETDRSGAFDPRYGVALSRSALLMTQTFRSGLLAAIDTFAGDTAVQATQFESEEPCHNCHQFALKYVLYYPATQVVVVVDGSYGYDS